MFHRFLVLLSILLVFSLYGCIDDGDQPKPQKPEYKPLEPSPYPIETKPIIVEGDIVKTPPRAPFEMTFLDMGHGDSTLIISQNKTILIDTGADKSANKLISTLKSKGITKIDLLILTSNDETFSSGALEILRRYDVEEVWTNSVNYDDLGWRLIIDAADKSLRKKVNHPDSKDIGGTRFTVLNPFEDEDAPNAQHDQLVIKAEYGSFCTILFGANEASGEDSYGSVTDNVERKILLSRTPIDCDIIKPANHGTAISTSFMILDAISPKDGIISVGPNDQGLPASVTLRRMMIRDTDVYITEKLGDIKVESFGTGYDISTEYELDSKYERMLSQIENGKIDYIR